MKQGLLLEAPEKIWEYDQEGYNALTEEDVRHSEMALAERKFIHGLLRYLKPQRILEVGVAEGGGSIVILNAIRDMPHSTLTSIDLMEQCWNNPTKRVGFACTEKYGSGHPQWELLLKKDPSEVIENLGQCGNFDFVIIDTAHIHPVETLNFLAVYPFLAENAIIVLHDISTYMSTLSQKHYRFPSAFFATKLLFDTLVGDKRILPASEYSSRVLSNLGVCQLNQDSQKYLGNVFSMLSFPWGKTFSSMDRQHSLIKNYYAPQLYQSFLSAYDFNTRAGMGRNQGLLRNLNTDPSHYKKKTIIFYGAGTIFLRLSQIFRLFSHPVKEIWDQNPKEDKITNLYGDTYLVKKPEYQLPDKEDLLLVLTVSDQSPQRITEMKEELQNAGFPHVIHFLELHDAL